MKRLLLLCFLVLALLTYLPYSEADAKGKVNPRRAYQGPATVEDYQEKAKAVNRAYSDTPKIVAPKDTKIIDLPNPRFKLVKYNNPPGTKELNLTDIFKTRQVNSIGVANSQGDKLTYTSVYYYPETNQTASEAFVIYLDESLSLRKRIEAAYIAKKEKAPILQAGMNDVDFGIQRTLTIVDYSADGEKIAIKEKIALRHEGLWQTNLWVYDFQTKKTKNLTELRDFIKAWYFTHKSIRLDDSRWDIYPLGWDANDSSKLLVYAYGYTGKKPLLLGTFSVRYDGSRPAIKSLYSTTYPIMSNGIILEEVFE